MQPTFDSLRAQLRLTLDNKTAQGHQTDGLYDQLAALPDSYDALAQFAERLATLPLRERIAYVAADDDINYTLMGMLVLTEQREP